MDIDSLRAELEQHLKNNPDGQAPEGFRHRFDQCVEHHKAETDPDDKAELEACLHRIRDEAAAAAKAGGLAGGAGEDSPVKRSARVEAEPAGRDPPGGPILAKGDPVVNPAPVQAPPPPPAAPVRGSSEPIAKDPLGGPILAKGTPVATPAPVQAAPPPPAAPVRGTSEPIAKDPLGGPILAKGTPVATPAPVEAPPAAGGSKARFGIGIAVVAALAAAAFFAYSAS